MKRLTEKTVFCGLVTAWRLATVPTRRSPLCANFRVLDDGRLAALEDGHARVRRAEVDADGLAHVGSGSFSAYYT
jgi:hypothetical protein